MGDLVSPGLLISRLLTIALAGWSFFVVVKLREGLLTALEQSHRSGSGPQGGESSG